MHILFKISNIAICRDQGCQIGRPRASRTSGTSSGRECSDVRSRMSGRPVGRSVYGVKLHLLENSGERFKSLDFYADDVDA